MQRFNHGEESMEARFTSAEGWWMYVEQWNTTQWTHEHKGLHI